MTSVVEGGRPGGCPRCCIPKPPLAVRSSSSTTLLYAPHNSPPSPPRPASAMQLVGCLCLCLQT